MVEITIKFDTVDELVEYQRKASFNLSANVSSNLSSDSKMTPIFEETGNVPTEEQSPTVDSFWTEEKIFYLKKQLLCLDNTTIANKMQIPLSDVICKRRELKIRKNKNLHLEIVENIVALFGNKTFKDILKENGLTYFVGKYIVDTLQLKKRLVRDIKNVDYNVYHTPWSEEDDRKLKSMYARSPMKIIAEELGRTETSIRTRAHSFHLKKVVRDSKRKIIGDFGKTRKEFKIKPNSSVFEKPAYFPKVRPLNSQETDNLYPVIERMIKASDKLDLVEMKTIVDLTETQWEEFIQNFLLNTTLIASYFDVKDKFRIISENGLKVIKYG